MNPSFLKSLSTAENPAEEARVHLRKAEIIYRLGMNTLATARAMKDYEVSRGVLESAKRNLDRAAWGIAETLRRGERSVDDLLPLFRDLEKGISEKMSELPPGSGSPGLGDEPVSSLASRVVSALTRWVEKTRSLREVHERAGPILDKIDQAMKWLYPEGGQEPEAEDLQKANWLLSLADRDVEQIPRSMPLREALKKSVRSASLLFRDAVDSFSQRKKFEQAQTADEVIRSVDEFQKAKSEEALIPVDAFETLRTKMESKLLDMVRFGPQSRVWDLPSAEDVMNEAEGMISKAENLLSRTATMNPRSVKFLKREFRAADLILGARKLIHQTGLLVGAPWEALFTEEEMRDVFPEKLTVEIIKDMARSKVERDALERRLKQASVQTKKLVNRSNFLRKIFGLPWFQPPASEA